uniref:Zgc:103681 n=1 Tax=Sinocyclocheilus rhinocerous TaxID=307959 RepID=A0A673KBS2_9TELE
MSTALATALQEWKTQEKELQQLQETQRLYLQKLEEISKLQKSFAASIARQKKNLKENSKALNKFNKGLCQDHGLSNEVKKAKDHIQNRLNCVYIFLVLGSVNVNLPIKEAKFKLYVTVTLFLLTFACRFFIRYKVVDALTFLLVWYYCTLTIHESILISNGSRIKGWWVFHHYISTFLSGVMPDGETYQPFRNQFLAYCLYQSFVQYLQYYYQSGRLYRLKALGERLHLDLTVEGFQSWMWRGLTFLLPFLFLGHFWQLWNSISLFRMAQIPECKEWQVSVHVWLLVLFVGNFFTTLAVVRHKRKDQQKTKSVGVFLKFFLKVSSRNVNEVFYLFIYLFIYI